MIKKECIIEDNLITITLVDPRDNYIYHDALGDIGDIFLSKDGVMIIVNHDYEKEIEMLREKELNKSFTEIFGTEEFNPLSGEYYNKIKTMVKNGTLVSLGYTIESKENYIEELTTHYKKH